MRTYLGHFILTSIDCTPASERNPTAAPCARNKMEPTCQRTGTSNISVFSAHHSAFLSNADFKEGGAFHSPASLVALRAVVRVICCSHAVGHSPARPARHTARRNPMAQCEKPVWDTFLAGRISAGLMGRSVTYAPERPSSTRAGFRTAWPRLSISLTGFTPHIATGHVQRYLGSLIVEHFLPPHPASQSSVSFKPGWL